MSSFDSLPNEINLKIFDLCINTSTSLERRTTGQFRLICRRLDELLCPILFSKFKIEDIERKIRRREEIALCLEAGKANVFKHVTELEVGMGLFGEVDETWFGLIDGVISLTENLRTISWKYRPSATARSLQWVNDFIGKLGSLNRLENFSILLGNNPPSTFSLEPLSALRSIRIRWENLSSPSQTTKFQIASLISRCSELDSFAFNTLYPPRSLLGSPFRPVTLGDLFAEALELDEPLRLKGLQLRNVTTTPSDFRLCIHHFRHLEKLEIGWDPDPFAAANFGEICSILQAEQIHLKSIHGFAIHPSGVLNYLSSYSGAEHIALKPLHPLDNSPQVVDHFFSSILSCHRDSLKSLDLGANEITIWSESLPRELLLEVEKCQLLEKLSVWLHLSLGPRTDFDVLTRWLETAKRLPLLRRFACPVIGGRVPGVLHRSPELYLELYISGFMGDHPDLHFSVDAFDFV